MNNAVPFEAGFFIGPDGTRIGGIGIHDDARRPIRQQAIGESADERRTMAAIEHARFADELAGRFAALQWRIMPDGAIWAMLLKKPIARTRSVTLTWEAMQAAALQTDLVDNKIASFSDEEYGTRFVIRRERRPSYATPPSNR